MLFLLFVVCALSMAQDKNQNCKFDFKVYTENQIEDEMRSIYKTEIKWNFSKLDLKNTTCVIEIVPMKDCMNGLDAIKLKPSVIISSTDKNFSAKGSKFINHLELMTKCFKWRVIVTNTKNSCTETTEWKYSSFLSQQ